jgi:hypothetical protein
MIFAILGLVAFLFVPLFCGWIVFVGAKKGRFIVRGFEYSRAESPIFFWTISALLVGLGLFFLAILGLIGLDALTHP